MADHEAWFWSLPVARCRDEESRAVKRGRQGRAQPAHQGCLAGTARPATSAARRAGRP